MQNESMIKFLTADEILSKEWPEPVWAVPGLLPAGLNVLAGAAKIESYVNVFLKTPAQKVLFAEVLGNLRW